MSVAVPKSERTTASVPADVQSPRAKLVCLYLATSGPATADDLAEDLEMGKMALFSVLGTLTGRDVVNADGDAYRLA